MLSPFKRRGDRMAKSKVKQYFPGGNTYLGFFSLWDSNIKDLTKLIILKGGPGTGKSTLLAHLAEEMLKDGWATEMLWCSSDAKSLDGVVFRELGLGVVDGTAPHTRDPLYPGVVDKIINLGECWNESLLQMNREQIINLTNANRALFKDTYQHLAQAKKYHDQLEELYIEGMNWTAVNAMTKDLLQQLFGSFDDTTPGQEIHRFAGAITPQGSVNYLDELLAEAKTRYIVKGRAGTGKSTLTKKIAATACSKGLAVESYHCSFDPLSIDNIFIPQLGICFIDGTPPHEKTPGTGDIVLDMFSFMSGSVYSKNQEQIKEVDSSYWSSFQKALSVLKECKSVHDQLEEYYIQAMDFKAVDELTQRLLSEIKEYAKTK